VKPDEVIGHPGRERFRQDARAPHLHRTGLHQTSRPGASFLSAFILLFCFFGFGLKVIKAAKTQTDVFVYLFIVTY
jgi:hypothetical protein